jgi:hypothetical protein
MRFAVMENKTKIKNLKLNSKNRQNLALISSQCSSEFLFSFHFAILLYVLYIYIYTASF